MLSFNSGTHASHREMGTNGRVRSWSFPMTRYSEQRECRTTNGKEGKENGGDVVLHEGRRKDSRRNMDTEWKRNGDDAEERRKKRERRVGCASNEAYSPVALGPL